MPPPYLIPDIWKHRDWESLCEQCGQALFMVGEAEKRLPVSGPIEVIRCPNCTRALCYRSNAIPANVTAYLPQPAQPDHATSAWIPRIYKRLAATKGLRTERFPH